MKKKDWSRVIHETYVELYDNATPKGDFNKLVDEADVDADGRKIIPYQDYKLNSELMAAIVNKQEQKYKMNPDQAQQFRMAIYLGCSPADEIIDDP